MKFNHIITLFLLCFPKVALCMESKTTFQDIPKELYSTIGIQGIISIINESPNILTAVEQVTKFLKNIRLTSKSFAGQLANYNELVKTFKDALKVKFASNLSRLSPEELNEKLSELNLHQLDRKKVANSRRISYLRKGKPLTEDVINLVVNVIINEAAKLIVAGASPNLVTALDPFEDKIYVESLLTVAIGAKELRPLIPLLLIYGADPNAKTVDYGNVSNFGLREVILLPLLRAIHIHDSKDAINIIKQLIDYKVNVNATDEFGHSALEIANASNEPEIVQLLKEHGAV